MRFLIAPDSFKGSIDAMRVAEILGESAAACLPGCSVDLLPMADGGEGTADVVRGSCGGEFREVMVHDPLLRPLKAAYLIIGDVALIEMARASGLTLLHPEERDPALTSSYGTGELIADALRQGCRQVLVAVGGSATCDGGAGALAALGMRFIDERAQPFVPTGGRLSDIDDMDPTSLARPRRGCHIRVLCDVDNPLLGPDGATYVFAPQKAGAPGSGTQAGLRRLEEGMRHYAEIVGQLSATVRACDPYSCPATGAAGGIGYALHMFLGAELVSGVDEVMDLVGFHAHLEKADAVVTGEGRLDSQSRRGKVVWGVMRAAREAGKPCYIVAGSVESGMLSEFGTLSDGLFSSEHEQAGDELVDALLGEGGTTPDASSGEGGQTLSLFSLAEDGGNEGTSGGGRSEDAPAIAGIEVASDKTMDTEYAMTHAEPLLKAAGDRLFTRISQNIPTT